MPTKEEKQRYKNNIINTIKKNSNKVPISNYLNNKNDINLHCWIKSNKIKNLENTNNLNFKNNINNEKEFIKSRKIILLPNEQQKLILYNWFEGYRLLYNEVINYFNKEYYNKRNPETSYMTVRTKILKEQKEIIRQKYNVPSHTLDYAIKTACAMLKSAITNKRKGYIKHFRLRYIKKSKNTRIIDIEKTAFSKNNFIFKKYIKEPILNKENYDYKEIKSDSKIYYNSILEQYILLIPQKIKVKENNKDGFISIDPGLRTFLTCITNNDIVELGTNINNYLDNNIKKIKRYEKLRNIEEKNITNQKIEHTLKRLRKEQLNKINDGHWKIINFLTKNYKNIVIGKWSTKQCISKKKKVQLNDNTKEKLSALSFHKFLQRLEFKSNINQNNLIIEKEHYTSQICSNCGNLKNIGASKTYNCKKCNITLDRDINSCKNIICKSLIDE
jgi:transposase